MSASEYVLVVGAILLLALIAVDLIRITRKPAAVEVLAARWSDSKDAIGSGLLPAVDELLHDLAP